LLLILAICFLMLVGVFFGSKEFTLEKYPGWIRFFMIMMFLGIVLIFLNALDWLKYLLELISNWDAEWAVTIIFMIIILGFMWYIVKDQGAPPAKEKS